MKNKRPRPDDLMIDLISKDDGDHEDCDDMYCAIVMGRNNCHNHKDGGWYNTGIVYREPTPEKAVAACLEHLREIGWKF